MAEKEIAIRPVLIVLTCDKCEAEIDTSNVSAEIIDGVKSIPSKCSKCGYVTQQSKRYPFVVNRRA